jgi:hypothetical protein
MQRLNLGPMRKITYDRSHPASPYKARVRIGPARVSLGRYRTRAEALAAEKSARKVVPFRPHAGGSPATPEARVKEVIKVYQTTGSKAQTARMLGMPGSTVKDILRRNMGTRGTGSVGAEALPQPTHPTVPLVQTPRTAKRRTPPTQRTQRKPRRPRTPRTAHKVIQRAMATLDKLQPWQE